MLKNVTFLLFNAVLLNGLPGTPACLQIQQQLMSALMQDGSPQDRRQSPRSAISRSIPGDSVCAPPTTPVDDGSGSARAPGRLSAMFGNVSALSIVASNVLA